MFGRFAQNRWFLAVLLLAAVSLMLIAIVNPFAPRSGYRIGVMLPISGDVASIGQPTLQGIQLAVDEENRHRPRDAQIDLSVQDTQAKPDLAINAYNQLAEAFRPAVIIGPLTSRESVSLLPRLDRMGIPVISPGASTSELDRKRDLFFRVELSDSAGGAAEADLAYETGARSVAIIFMSDEYGQGLERVFRERFTARGGRVALSVAFTPAESEFRPTLRRVATTDADTLFIIGIDETVNIIRQARQQDLRLRLLTTPIFENKTYLSKLGHDAEGVELVRYGTFDTGTPNGLQQPSSDGGREFTERYLSRYGSAPSYYSALGYDAAKLAVAALNKGRQRIGAAEATRLLRSGLTVQGLSGALILDEFGDVRKPITLLVVKDGQFVRR
jgi:branched-chain amino acid transport system substrate-binding protein